MESACRVAIILSISSACCSRPTSSRASSAVKHRGKRPRVRWKDIKCFVWRGQDQNPVSTHPVTQRLTDPVNQAFQQQLEVWTPGYQPLQCTGCTRTCHNLHPSSHTRCCLSAENRHEKKHEGKKDYSHSTVNRLFSTFAFKSQNFPKNDFVAQSKKCEATLLDYINSKIAEKSLPCPHNT